MPIIEYQCKRLRLRMAQILIGLGALALGVFVYAFHRGQVPLFDYTPQIRHTFSFGTLADTLPSLLHTFAFSVLTGALISPRTRNYTIICIGWASINSALELGQLKAIHPLFGDHIDSWRPRGFVGEYVQRYFALGTFDGWDVVATLAGALAAFFTLEATRRLSGGSP